MYFKITLLSLFLLNFIIVKCEKCKDYNYDYYYPTKIDKIETNKFNNSKKIMINNLDFYISNKKYETLIYMGTGILPNGTYINVEKNNTFYIKNNYAIGSYDNKLTPWISISDNTYKYGTKVYIDFFNNLNITVNNNTLTHNGCFRIDDQDEENCFIRIFTEKQINNKDINKNLINIKKQDNCTLLNMYF